MALQVLAKKSLVMMSVVTVLVTQLHGMMYQTPTKVLYITSANGNFLVAPGMSIQPWDAFLLVKDIGSCKDESRTHALEHISTNTNEEIKDELIINKTIIRTRNIKHSIGAFFCCSRKTCNMNHLFCISKSTMNIMQCTQM